METFLVKYIEGETNGTYAISVVNDPANEFELVALSKENLKLRAVDRDKRLFFAAVLIPGQKILRKSAEGEPFYIMFEQDTIRMAQQNFIKQGYQNNSTLEHDENAVIEGITFVEHWIKEDDVKDKSVMYTDEKLALGTWCTVFKVNNDEILDKIESGEINGISIDGEFKFEKVNLKKSDMDFKQILNDTLVEFGLKKVEPVTVKLGSIPTSDESKTVYFEGEMLSKGAAVFADEEMTEKMPDGEHELMTNVIITVSDGMVTEIKEVEKEEEVEAKQEDVTMSDELSAMIDAKISDAFKTMAVQMAKAVSSELEAIKVELKKETVKVEEVALTAAKPEPVQIPEAKTFRDKMFNELQQTK